MAPSHVQSECKINYTLLDTKKAVAEAVKEIKRCSLIAVDLEGVSLCRHGPITILSIATPNFAYLIDVLTLPEKAFPTDIVTILEEKPKIMYDCRTDSDALFHQYGVKLGSVTDLQLMHVLTREVEGQIDLQRFNTRMKVVQPGQEMVTKYTYLSGLKKCMELHLESSRYFRAKEEIDMGNGGSNFWAERPLSEKMLEYASADVLSLFLLCNKFQKKCNLNNPRLQLASKRFESIKRDREKCCDCDLLNTKALLPLEVIPPPRGEETVPSRITCLGCQRDLPDKYFSQLDPNLRYYCAVCRRALAEEKRDEKDEKGHSKL